MSVLISGGGLGGLSAALAASQAGLDVRLFEKAPAFSAIGAGIQLGPNVVRILNSWGLGVALQRVSVAPEKLLARSALTGELLGSLRLGPSMAGRYGAPYLTVHRADLHGVLLAAVKQADSIRLHLNRPVTSFSQNAQTVTVRTFDDMDVEGEVLLAADGLWSTVRPQLLGDGPPRATGQLAYRALVQQSSLPAALRSSDVTVWLGPKMHVVQYPVSGGDALNLVAIIEGQVHANADSWNHAASHADLAAAMSGNHASLQDLVRAVEQWRLWTLHDREPMQGAHQHALGRVALIGDAAHPMLPYLAQGAGMAIEDAAELGHVLRMSRDPAFDMPVMLQRYGLNRWQRNAKVQARSTRNSKIFHADGLLRVARDVSMRLFGERLLDMPWLYGAVHKSARGLSYAI